MFDTVIAGRPMACPFARALAIPDLTRWKAHSLIHGASGFRRAGCMLAYPASNIIIIIM